MTPTLIGPGLARIGLQATDLNLVNRGQFGNLVPVDTWLVTTAVSTQACAIGPAFSADIFRGRFTLTVGGQETLLSNVAQLASFDHPVSQFRELTSLGDVPSRFPSVRALYLGQISGVVVIVPQRYAIVRGDAGVQARCDAIVDASSSSLSGCQFSFSFTLAPDVSPVDLAQLAVAIDACPESQVLPPSLALPSGLDARFPQDTTGQDPPITIVDAGDADTLAVTITVRDQANLPAVTAANILLSQLAADGPSPLTVPIAVRIDDAYPTAVVTSAVVNIRHTASGDDIAVAATIDDPPQVQVTNLAPQSLVLQRIATLEAAGLTTSSLNDTSLAAGDQLAITATPTVSATTPAIDRRLDVASPLPPAQIGDYVTLNVNEVQNVQHALVVNAAAVSFNATGVTSLDVGFTMNDQPGTTVPGFTLLNGHISDSTHVIIPVLAVVSGLSITVTLTPSTAAGPQPSVTVQHDFVDEPILIVSDSMLTSPPPT